MRNLSLTILLIAVLIAALGVLSIYSSTYNKEGGIWDNIYQRQMFWVFLGVLIYLLMSNFNYRRLWDMNYFLYAGAVGFLLLVVLLGIARLGAQRWLKLVWFSFQPSEVVKLVIIIFLARYFSKKSADDISFKASKFGIWRGVILPFVFVGIPALLIIEQPDLGTGAILIFIFMFMLYLGNVRIRYLYLIAAFIILTFPFFWHYLRDYQKDRILVFLNPNIDPLGAGYTIIQSKIAIGSGGLFGKGWLLGTQSQLRFLPESHTDFIFATFAEEWGLFGSAILIFLYFLLIYYGMMVAQRTNDQFARLLSYGISFMLAIQVCINIGMNIGIAPVVGLPLPLMSYGGSNICVTFAALGILANISKRRMVF